MSTMTTHIPFLHCTSCDRIYATYSSTGSGILITELNLETMELEQTPFVEEEFPTCPECSNEQCRLLYITRDLSDEEIDKFKNFFQSISAMSEYMGRLTFIDLNTLNAHDLLYVKSILNV